MAKSDGTVYVNTLIDTKGFGKGVNTMQKQIGGLSGAIGKLGLAITATFAVGKLIQFGKEAIELGSDLQEVQNVVDVTFTTMSEQVNEFAKNAAMTAGLSETMAKRYTGTFGAMAKAFGFAEGEAFDMSTSLTQLAGDVASFYNLTQDEAYTKLKSVFTGETESLKDLGVVMTQTALDSFAMAEGYGKTTKQMSEQEKVALRYAFVLDQLSTASGDFVRTQDSWANQTRILSLNFDSFKANIGQALINIFTPFLKVINQIVAKMAQLSQHFVAFSKMLVGKQTSGGGGSPGEALEGISDGYSEITDATEEATRAQKKYLSGLDEIRTFSSEEDAISGIGGVSIGDIDSTTAGAVEDTIASIEELEAKYPKLIGFARNSIETLKSIFHNFMAGDFFAVGQDVTTLVTGFYNFFSEAIDSVDWQDLGNHIGNYLAGVDWIDIIKAALKLKISFWEALADIWIGAFETAPFETALISAFAAMQFTGLGAVISSAIGKAISTQILAAGGLSGLLTLDMVALVGETGWATAGLLAGGALIGGIVAAFFGWNLGQFLYEKITGEEIKLSFLEQMQEIKDSFTDGSWKDALSLWGKDIKDGFAAMGKDLVNAFKSRINQMITYINAIIFSVETGLNHMIAAINKLSFEVPEWVPVIGGKNMGFNIQKVAFPRIPMLATGAVIPPNAPFMAMLGDQKHGNNIEAPEALIRKVVREESGNGGSRTIHNVVQINRRTLLDEMVEEAKLQQSTTGRNPFELT